MPIIPAERAFDGEILHQAEAFISNPVITKNDEVKAHAAALASIPGEYGSFSVQSWGTKDQSYAITFTPRHGKDSQVWQTFNQNDLLKKVTALLEAPEDASTLLHQQIPIDPDGSSDDLR